MVAGCCGVESGERVVPVSGRRVRIVGEAVVERARGGGFVITAPAGTAILNPEDEEPLGLLWDEIDGWQERA